MCRPLYYPSDMFHSDTLTPSSNQFNQKPFSCSQLEQEKEFLHPLGVLAGLEQRLGDAFNLKEQRETVASLPTILF